MRLSIRAIGKSNESYIKEGVEEFTKRISNYFPIAWNIIFLPKSSGLLSSLALKRKESEMILQSLKQDDFLVALDENGKQFNSEGVAKFLQQRASDSTKNIVFLIGGSYGLDSSILEKAQLRWSLSSLTFPHQLVRLILAEQIYRACTILRNEKYHHNNCKL